MTDSQPRFKNFKDAYCAAHECPAGEFESKVFWRCLQRRALAVASLFGWRWPDFFQADREAVSAIGRASSEGELRVLVNDFENLREVERGWLRATFRIRLSSVRLLAVFLELVPLLHPTVATLAPQESVPAPTGGRREAADSSGLTVRRLKRFQAEVISGRNPERAALEAELDPATIHDLLVRHQEGRPELAWLGDCLRQQERIVELQRENERLTRLLADRAKIRAFTS